MSPITNSSISFHPYDLEILQLIDIIDNVDDLHKIEINTITTNLIKDINCYLEEEQAIDVCSLEPEVCSLEPEVCSLGLSHSDQTSYCSSGNCLLNSDFPYLNQAFYCQDIITGECFNSDLPYSTQYLEFFQDGEYIIIFFFFNLSIILFFRLFEEWREKHILPFLITIEVIIVFLLIILLLGAKSIVRGVGSGYIAVLTIIAAGGASTALSLALFISYFKVTGKFKIYIIL